MPESFGSRTTDNYIYSIYATYTTSEQAPELLGNPYMFTGRRFDIETGLYHYRARCYNPHIGRFMQTDPVGYGYGYCGNNPLGRVDPSGMIWQSTGSILTIPTIFATGAAGVTTSPGSVVGMIVNVTALAAASPVTQGMVTAGVLNCLSAVHMTLSTSHSTWRSYFEVADYNDVNGDGVIDANDLEKGQTFDDIILGRKWVEVIGVIDLPEKEAGSYYIEGAGYSDPTAAFYGAWIAANSYPYDVDEIYMDPLVPRSAFGDEFPVIPVVEGLTTDVIFEFSSDLISQMDEIFGN